MKSRVRNTLLPRLPYLGLAGFVLLLDQISKSFIQKSFDLGQSVSVVEGFFELIYVRNTGVAFGVFSSVASPAKSALLSTFAAVAVVVVVVYSVRSSAGHHFLQAALALILGGALGNLYDRIAHGYVIDFLNFHFGSYDWPTFNVADTAITLGVRFLAAEIIRDEIRDRV